MKPWSYTIGFLFGCLSQLCRLATEDFGVQILLMLVVVLIGALTNLAYCALGDK
jgi:hypothetical protein